MRSSGKLEWIIAGTAEGPRTRGNPGNRTPAQQKGDRGTGQPGAETQVGREDRECGQPATRSAGRRDDERSYELWNYPESARGRKVSGVFNLRRNQADPSCRSVRCRPADPCLALRCVIHRVADWPQRPPHLLLICGQYRENGPDQKIAAAIASTKAPTPTSTRFISTSNIRAPHRMRAG